MADIHTDPAGYWEGRAKAAWDREDALGLQIMTLQSQLEAVKALADQWAKRWDVPEAGVLDMAAKHYRAAAQRLHAVIAEPITRPVE